MMKNIILFGETGVGKSSLLNLLKGEDVAAVSDSAVGCTFEFKEYKISNNRYNVYDTVGLSEGSAGTVTAERAIRSLKELLRQLSKQGGVHLLIFVAKQDRITKTMEENFNLFVEAICKKEVPVLLFITKADLQMNPNKWWVDNEKEFTRYGMTFKGAVVGCAANPEGFPPPLRPKIFDRRLQSRAELMQLIDQYSLSSPWVMKEWFQGVLLEVIKVLMRVSANLFCSINSVADVLEEVGGIGLMLSNAIVNFVNGFSTRKSNAM